MAKGYSSDVAYRVKVDGPNGEEFRQVDHVRVIRDDRGRSLACPQPQLRADEEVFFTVDGRCAVVYIGGRC